MNLSEKSAYLKGLMDGLKLDQEAPEGKMISGIVELLQEVTGAIGDLQENAEAVSDELDEIEDDLDAIEDYLMDDDDEEDGHDREGEERGYRLRHSGGLEPAGERFAAHASSVMSFQMFSPTPTIPGSQTLAPSKVDSQRRPLCQTLSPFL